MAKVRKVPKSGS